MIVGAALRWVSHPAAGGAADKLADLWHNQKSIGVQEGPESAAKGPLGRFGKVPGGLSVLGGR